MNLSARLSTAVSESFNLVFLRLLIIPLVRPILASSMKMQVGEKFCTETSPSSKSKPCPCQLSLPSYRSHSAQFYPHLFEQRRQQPRIFLDLMVGTGPIGCLDSKSKFHIFGMTCNCSYHCPSFMGILAIGMSSAALSGFLIGSFMCVLVLLCRRWRLNPGLCMGSLFLRTNFY
jgi:hypothetical protein